MKSRNFLSPVRYHATLGLCLASGFIAVAAKPAAAQITVPRVLSATPDRYATLEEQLINRLHATAEDQQAYLRFVVNQVREGKLEARLVIAIQQYAIRRNSQLPFLYFERALRGEAAKRGVVLPPVRQFASTAAPR